MENKSKFALIFLGVMFIAVIAMAVLSSGNRYSNTWEDNTDFQASSTISN